MSSNKKKQKPVKHRLVLQGPVTRRLVTQRLVTQRSFKRGLVIQESVAQKPKSISFENFEKRDKTSPGPRKSSILREGRQDLMIPHGKLNSNIRGARQNPILRRDRASWRFRRKSPITRLLDTHPPPGEPPKK